MKLLCLALSPLTGLTFPLTNVSGVIEAIVMHQENTTTSDFPLTNVSGLIEAASPASKLAILNRLSADERQRPH